MDRYNSIKTKILQILQGSGDPGEVSNSLNTLEWVNKLTNNQASEFLQIAALSHDIDRAVDPSVLQKESETYKVKHMMNIKVDIVNAAPN